MDLDSVLEQLETSELEEKFNDAAAYLQNIVGNLDAKHLLEFYGLYKQSTIGPCNIPKPGIFSMQARSKWIAWNDLGKISKELAMEKYVEKLNDIEPEWNENSAAGTSTGQKRPTWISVSTLLSQETEEERLNEPRTLIDHVKCENIDGILAFFSAAMSLNQTDEEKEEAINEMDDDGLASVHWAADRGFGNILEILLNHGADVNLKDLQSGQTALHYAISCGHNDCIQILMKHGANATIPDGEGTTCLDLAAEDPNIMQLLRT